MSYAITTSMEYDRQAFQTNLHNFLLHTFNIRYRSWRVLSDPDLMVTTIIQDGGQLDRDIHVVIPKEKIHLNWSQKASYVQEQLQIRKLLGEF